jgi:hypothetical protein
MSNYYCSLNIASWWLVLVEILLPRWVYFTDRHDSKAGENTV